MNILDLIYKKRDGGKLSREDIRYFVEGYTEGSIPDYQASALLMAIFFEKLDEEETYELTMAMRDSGDIADLSAISGIKVDKHSTGGVGDKTTLIVAPIAASAGVKIAKMSGRGLGFTGGTIDKLEAIPGMRTSLETGEFYELVNRLGMSVIGQTAHIAAADKKLYALRDVTGTVENTGLIASSIMSKKLASGSDSIVLDVKCGNGAFMEHIEEAEELARAMVKIGESAGKRIAAFITDMNQPLGRAVGNSIEVAEAASLLRLEEPDPELLELSLYLSGAMIFLGGKASGFHEGRELAREKLESGAAYEKLREFVSAQGGDASVLSDPEFGRKAKYSADYVYHGPDAFVSAISTREVGLASQHAGAGRARKDESIDPEAGIYLEAKIGSLLKDGSIAARVYSNDEGKLRTALSELKGAYKFSSSEPEKPKLIKEIIGQL